MKNIFICLFAMFFLSNCTDDKDELIIGEPNKEGTTSKPSLENGIEKKLFDVINLDYPGLEEVKKHYQAEEYYEAAKALLEYYRLRTEVINPNISLISTTASASEQNMAEQALEYRFYIRNFQEKKGETDADNVYYSFKNKDGKIDWNYIPSGITDNGWSPKPKLIGSLKMNHMLNHGLKFIQIGWRIIHAQTVSLLMIIIHGSDCK